MCSAAPAIWLACGIIVSKTGGQFRGSITELAPGRRDGRAATFGSSPVGLGLLFGRQFRRPAHSLPALLRQAAALGGAGTDKVTLHVREAAENGNHQAPGAGAGVGPRLRERPELRLRVHDAFNDAEQIEGAAR
jgi:hypothetical protein